MHQILSLLLAALSLVWPGMTTQQRTPSSHTEDKMISLPAPKTDGRISVERALLTRRSVRSFKDVPLSLATVSQIVWAAQGITQTMEAPPGWPSGAWQGGKRTAPSAGALYPLELYVAAGNVDGLKSGIYRYKPQTHQLILVKAGDHRSELADAAVGQAWVGTAPCIIIVGAVFGRTEAKYGRRAERYVHIEAGHAVENICLQAVALDLGSTMVGAFIDRDVRAVLGMPKQEEPLAIVPVGKAAENE